jgi:2-polyprenylphenol 6-hydroxylase
MQQFSYDIIIVGGGMVGLTLACALAQQTNLSILVLESKKLTDTWSQEIHHPRVSAIALSSQRIFQSLSVWDDIKHQRVSPFTRIQVWDAGNQNEISFHGNDIAEGVLGFIVENELIQTALFNKIKEYSSVHVISPIALSAMHEKDDHIQLATEDGRLFLTKLVVAADGANSFVRNAAGIALNKKEYEESAIVATIKTTLPHHQTARQVFLSSGPLAFLPLASDTLCSIVWTLKEDEAAQWMNADVQTFNQALAAAFSGKCGEVALVGERYRFPLSKQKAKDYVKARIALVGDAAHTVHPLAGRGVNMGLLDASSLVDVIVTALAERRDFSSLYTLRRYERWRKADNQTMLSGVDLIHSLFETDIEGVQALRSVGMKMVNQMRFLKNIFARHAVGNRVGLPTLAMEINP